MTSMTTTMAFLLSLATATMTQEGSIKSSSAEAAKQAKRHEPSLVELARQTQRNKAGSRKPVRLITNADLAKLSGAKVSTGQFSSRPAVRKTTSEEVETADHGITPDLLAEWQQAFAEAAGKIQLEANQGAVLQLRMNNLRNAFLRQSDGSRQARIQALLQDTLRQIETNKQAQTKAREALSELQSKARTAGFTQAEIAGLTGKIAEPSAEIVPPETGNQP